MEQTAARVGSKVNETRFDRIFNVVVYVLLALMLIVVIYPLYFVLLASVSDPQYVNSGTPLLYPRGFTLMGYSRVFADNRIWIGYANTILYAGLGMVVSTMVQVMAGYSLSRRDLPGRSIFMGLFVFTMYFGGGLIPFYLVVKQLNLVNSRILMIILGCSSVYNIIIARSFFTSSLPVELYEAASIDGANEFICFFRIAIPLAGSIIAVIALFVASASWNGYYSALLYIRAQRLYPLQLVLRDILINAQNAFKNVEVNSADADVYLEALRLTYLAESMKYSIIFIASFPMLALYPFVQKYFVKGVMIGAVKG